MAQILAANKTSGVPVVDNENKVVGFISDGDIMKYIGRSDGSVLDATRMLYRIPDTENFMQRVADLIDLNVMRIATKGAISVLAAPPSTMPAVSFAEKRIKKIPVVDAEGCLVGHFRDPILFAPLWQTLHRSNRLLLQTKKKKGERQRT